MPFGLRQDAGCLWCKRRNAAAWRQNLRGLNVRRESEPAEQAHKLESQISLPPIQTVACRCRKGMMIVVPTLAHREQRGPRHVVGLDRALVDDPALWTVRMADVANEPVHRYADRDADHHAP